MLALAVIIPATAQRKKKDDETLTPAFTEGVVYALPRTGIRIHVQAVKKIFEPGPYAAYANQLLGITNAGTKPRITWEFSGITLETFSEPDPLQVHKALGDASFLISLTHDGCLAGINAGVKYHSNEKIVTNSFISQPEKENGFSFENINDSPLYTPGDSTNNFRPVRLTVEQMAAKAAAKVLNCRTIQYDMAAGMMDEFHPDGEAYKISLRELKETEVKYLSLFSGRTRQIKESFSFDYLPVTAPEKGEVIFRFSDENGVVPPSDLSGKPVMIRLETVKELIGKYSSLVKSDNPSAGESGVYYRMPGIADIQVVFELKTIASARAAIAQLGEVAPLPEELLYGEFAIEFHPETGAVKSITRK